MFDSYSCTQLRQILVIVLVIYFGMLYLIKDHEFRTGTRYFLMVLVIIGFEFALTYALVARPCL
jgi:hypothetical protein